MQVRVRNSLILVTIFGVGLATANLAFAAAADVNLCAITNVSCSGQNTTATGTASSSTATLANAKDFANSQGFRWDHAGAVAGVGQPTGLGAAAVGTTGSTAYLYQVSNVDANGGVSQASAAGGISNGNADLDWNHYVEITWSAGGGTVTPCYVIWRSKDGGAYTYLKSLCNSTTVWDFDIADEKPDWVPSTPPAAALADWLKGTISSGGGTTSLTLSTPAITTCTGTNCGFWHDDGALIKTAITTRNASATKYSLNAPGAADIYYSEDLGALSTNDSYIEGSGSSPTFHPNGVGYFGLSAVGPLPTAGTACTLSADIVEGKTVSTLSSVSGLARNDLVAFSRYAPTDINTGNYQYFYASPIQKINGTNVTLNDSTPIVFPPKFSTVTVSSTGWLTNDTITVNFSGQNPASVTYTVTAGLGGSGNTVAHRVALAINAATSVTGNRVYAFNNLNVVYVYIPSALTTTFTASKSSISGTVSATQNDAATATTCNKWNPIKRVGFRNLALDGKGLFNTAVYIAGTADGDLSGLRVHDAKIGPAIYSNYNYSLHGHDWLTENSGSSAPNFVSQSDWIMQNFSVLQLSDIRGRGSASFGGQLQVGTNAQLSNVFAMGAQAGRAFKIEATAGWSIANLTASNPAATSFAIAFGANRGLIANAQVMGGNHQLQSNGTLVWNADTFSELNRFHGVQTAGATKDDYAFSLSDRNNSVHGCVMGYGDSGLSGFGQIYNTGLARFRDCNGYNQAGGATGIMNFDGTTVGAPTIMFDTNR